MGRADESIDALLAPFATPASFRKLKALYIRRFDNLPPETVTDALQQSFVKTLKFYRRSPSAPRTPAEMENLLHTVIRRTLIDDVRHSQSMTFVSLDEDYAAIARAPGVDPEDPKADVPPRAPAGPPSPAKGKWRPAPVRPDDDEGLENTLVEQIDVRNLLVQVLGQLDARYRRVVIQLLVEFTPNEIAATFGTTTGYKLRLWARVKVCRILGALALLGNDMAERLQRGGQCGRILAQVTAAPQ